MKGLMTSATETLVYDICLLQTVNWLTLTESNYVYKRWHKEYLYFPKHVRKNM